MPWFLSWDLLQGLGEGFSLHAGCVFKDKNLMFVLLKYFASLHMFHNTNYSLLKSCHGRGRSLAAIQPQFLKWCLFSAILLPCLHVSCVYWFWLHVFHALSLCSLCATLWSHNQDIVEDFVLPVMHRWAAHYPGLAGGGERSFQPWAEPQEPWAPSLAGSQGYHNTFAGTSWANLCPGRLECSPESLMQSSGSLWLRKILLLSAMALTDWSWCILLQGLI